MSVNDKVWTIKLWRPLAHERTASRGTGHTRRTRATGFDRRRVRADGVPLEAVRREPHGHGGAARAQQRALVDQPRRGRLAHVVRRLRVQRGIRVPQTVPACRGTRRPRKLLRRRPVLGHDCRRRFCCARRWRLAFCALLRIGHWRRHWESERRAVGSRANGGGNAPLAGLRWGARRRHGLTSRGRRAARRRGRNGVCSGAAEGAASTVKGVLGTAERNVKRRPVPEPLGLCREPLLKPKTLRGRVRGEVRVSGDVTCSCGDKGHKHAMAQGNGEMKIQRESVYV